MIDVTYSLFVQLSLRDIKDCSKSMGRGKMMVEFFSAEIVLRVCRYRSWRAAGASVRTSAASFSDLDAFCSPSAAITWEIQRSFYNTNGCSLTLISYISDSVHVFTHSNDPQLQNDLTIIVLNVNRNNIIIFKILNAESELELPVSINLIKLCFTLALASLAASASAAMALCNCTGSRTSLL